MKKIVKKWKDQVSAQKNTAKAKPHTHLGAAPSHTSSNTPNGNSASNPSNGASAKTRTPASDGVKTAVHGDKVRDSCIELIYKALAIETTETGSKILECSKDIEAAVFDGEKGASKGYRQKLLSLVSNLKDPRNPGLRGRVLNGDISGTKLYNMKPHELASEDVKKDIENIKKENLFNAQAAVEKRAVTDRFTCGKCKQKKVSYFQMQTRSADEPLTTFCTCEHCGNRWKFS